MKPKCSLTLAFTIGVVAGLRSMMAPAAVASTAQRNPRALRHSRLSFLGSPHSAKVMNLLAMGELVADKLPFAPSRTNPPSLVTRLISGAVSGAAVAISERGSAVEGVLLGSAGAVAGAFGGYHLRRQAGRKLHVPDLVIAPLEDLLALAGAQFITSRW